MRFFLISLYDYESVGIRALAGALARAGVDFKVHFFQSLDFNRVQAPSLLAYDALINSIRAFNPDCVGLSVRSPFAAIAAEITARIHRDLQLPVLWGGAHATVRWRESLEHADYVCRGEGEGALVRFLSGEIFPLPPGIAARASQSPPDVQFAASLDELADPLYANDSSQYQDGESVHAGDPLLGDSPFAKYGEPWMHETLGSRGCPYRCSYCAAPILSSPRIRVRSPGRVVAEIADMAARRRVESVNFLDEVFGVDLDWLRELSATLPRQLALPFTAEMHPNLCTPERVSLCAKAGMVGVEMGIQSGSERIRRTVFNRPVTQKTILDAVQTLQAHDIAVTVDIILDNPYETEDDLVQTFQLVTELPQPLGVKTFSLVHLPGTALTDRLLTDGLIAPGEVEDTAFKSHRHWRARAGHEREPWRQHWTMLILLAAARNRSPDKASWLSIGTRDDLLVPAFSPQELRRIASDPAYLREPERLRELLRAVSPVSALERML